jgi:hypothetical protein
MIKCDICKKKLPKYKIPIQIKVMEAKITLQILICKECKKKKIKKIKLIQQS